MGRGAFLDIESRSEEPADGRHGDTRDQAVRDLPELSSIQFR